MTSTRVLRVPSPFVAALAALGVALVVSAVVLAVLVLRPPQPGTVRGDAVVVHDGGEGERHDLAFRLMDEGVAPILVIFGGVGDEEARGACEEGRPYEVLCPTPMPSNTAGEARIVGRLAAERGWEVVVAVTSDYHVRRTLMLDRSCTSAEVVAVPAQPDLGVAGRVWTTVHEMVGLPFSWLFQRC